MLLVLLSSMLNLQCSNDFVLRNLSWALVIAVLSKACFYTVELKYCHQGVFPMRHTNKILCKLTH